MENLTEYLACLIIVIGELKNDLEFLKVYNFHDNSWFSVFDAPLLFLAYTYHTDSHSRVIIAFRSFVDLFVPDIFLGTVCASRTRVFLWASSVGLKINATLSCLIVFGCGWWVCGCYECLCPFCFALAVDVVENLQSYLRLAVRMKFLSSITSTILQVY